MGIYDWYYIWIFNMRYFSVFPLAFAGFMAQEYHTESLQGEWQVNAASASQMTKFEGRDLFIGHFGYRLLKLT